MKERSDSPRECHTPFLEWRNVSVTRGEQTVLADISVTIPEGEHVAIIGPNGAGKSSFIKAVTREYYPSDGTGECTFRMWGREQWDVWELRSSLGVVSNDLHYIFMRDLSGMEMVLSGFYSSIGLFRQEVTPAMRARAEEILAFLDMAHLRDRPVASLSSGEVRRLLIGRALVHSPRVLLLDEPTNSLDLQALHIFRETLRKVARAGIGIIMVTHNIPRTSSPDHEGDTDEGREVAGGTVPRRRS